MASPREPPDPYGSHRPSPTGEGHRGWSPLPRRHPGMPKFPYAENEGGGEVGWLGPDGQTGLKKSSSLGDTTQPPARGV